MADSFAASRKAIAGWDEFIECLRTLPERMLAKLPEHRRGDVARHSGHVRPGDRRTVHQAHNVEIEPWQQGAPDDT